LYSAIIPATAISPPFWSKKISEQDPLFFEKAVVLLE
jgi:hypothetical protein